jgi:hypothetical protein
MHLLEAWTRLGPFGLASLLALPLALLFATLLPGRAVSRAAAAIAMLAVLVLHELTVPLWIRLAWAALWGVIAWQAGRADRDASAGPAPARRRAFEAGAVALPLGLALLALMLAALSRQTFMADEAARRASLGALLVGLSLLHLMMRRHVRRAIIAVGGMGVGLELLTASARALDVAHEGPPAGSALCTTAMVLILMLRVAHGRERYAGSVFVSDAHELQD